MSCSKSIMRFTHLRLSDKSKSRTHTPHFVVFGGGGGGLRVVFSPHIMTDIKDRKISGKRVSYGLHCFGHELLSFVHNQSIIRVTSFTNSTDGTPSFHDIVTTQILFPQRDVENEKERALHGFRSSSSMRITLFVLHMS